MFLSLGISRLARCRLLQPGLQWPVSSTSSCWTTGVCQPLNQPTRQTQRMLMAGGRMQSNPSITPRWFNQLPDKCWLGVLWYYTNTVITSVHHFAIKYNSPGLENTILLSAVCSPLIGTHRARCLFESATAALGQNTFCFGVLSNFFLVYEIRKSWEQLSG